MSVSRPMLRYHGGKFLLAEWVIEHFPRHRIYVEPFGGAGSVLLKKDRSYQDVYNDLDGEIVNLFRVVRERGAELVAALELTPYSRDEFATSYDVATDPVEQARRTVIRSFMGHGSNSHNRPTGFRRHSRLSGTSPCNDWRNYPPALVEIVERLQGVVIENRDALGLIEEQDSPDTLFYLDPPYVMATRDKGSDYRHEMTDGQHRDLAELLHRVKGMVVLSGYHSDLYNELYADWPFIDRAALADGARARTETLWLSPSCSLALSRERAQQGLEFA
ncbi:DNA adenine methylase [Paraburkholderia phenoliruptrix]|uniref:DNA adenine methylase n=1 Tax=Paraburkholderia phenoliruptrix TaxID=252970 RepID=UPI00285AED54|nr:DNA adenine methylase [Paraburkholderia phenoliruptrix]MDR6421342.1 DNA adenine methylase [Paraburkholderia phenoliruptrix]